MNKVFLNKLRYLYGKISSPVNHSIFSPLVIDKSGQEASDYIRLLIESEKPVMIARFGSTELGCIVDYLNSKTKYKYLKYIKSQINSYEFTDYIKQELLTHSGLFPITNEILLRFSQLMISEIHNLDVLGSWRAEESILNDYYNGCINVNLSDLEPYYHTNPWSSVLKGKKVLVIHPFAKTIESQYSKREMLFQNKEILPEFDLKVLKSVQTISAEEGNLYSNWFDALEKMKNDINQIDFEIALIGCGAYGFPLASHVKKIGKKAIHLGGATQILFGIKGRRWESIPFFQNLFNENWVRPSKNETPSKANLLENACYW